MTASKNSGHPAEPAGNELLDRPEILQILFHPRPAPAMGPSEAVEEIGVKTPDGETVGCRLHLADADAPHILYFHGNGEIAHDYDDIGPVYNAFGINFIVADYRGYGISTGTPTVSAMRGDAYAVFDEVVRRLRQQNRSGPLWLMGRSLGSAPAVELAAARPDQIRGLIIESGFAHTAQLLDRLGAPAGAMGITDDSVFSNARKITRYNGPTLVIHAENDQIIPLPHGKTLYQESPAAQKALEVIAGADHNTIFMVAGRRYFQIIKDFIDQAGKSAGA